MTSCGYKSRCRPSFTIPEHVIQIQGKFFFLRIFHYVNFVARYTGTLHFLAKQVRQLSRWTFGTADSWSIQLWLHVSIHLRKAHTYTNTFIQEYYKSLFVQVENEETSSTYMVRLPHSVCRLVLHIRENYQDWQHQSLFNKRLQKPGAESKSVNSHSDKPAQCRVKAGGGQWKLRTVQRRPTLPPGIGEE